jgi:hypothetical protein
LHRTFHFSMILVHGGSATLSGLGPLLRDISPLHHSLCCILSCKDATVSLGDAPVDRDLKKVSHSGGHDNSLDSTRQFHLPVWGRSSRPGHSAVVCQFLASTLTPSRSKPVKHLVETPRYQSAGEGGTGISEISESPPNENSNRVPNHCVAGGYVNSQPGYVI